MKYIDTHSHLHFQQYDSDREDVINRMRSVGVGTIVIGTDLETSKQALALVRKYPDAILGATIGVHPNDTDEVFNEKEFEQILCEHVIAVGECGLDYFRNDANDSAEKARQKENFQRHIDFALKHDLPLMLHVRDAHEDALEILTDTKATASGSRLRGTAHFFTGTPEIAQRYIDLGFHISFPGVITFAKETEDAVRAVPIERILVETDAPYAAPTPHRGARNEPAFVVEMVKKIAEIKELPEEAVQKQLLENTKALFGT